MAEIAGAAAEAKIHGRATRPAQDTPAAAVMHAAVELADELEAAAIVVPTASGGAPRACAMYRPRRPIVALAFTPGVANQLALEWGVQPCEMPEAATVDELVEAALAGARELAGLAPGELVVITAGAMATAGGTDLIMVREVPSPS